MLYLSSTALHSGQEVGDSHAKVVVAVHLQMPERLVQYAHVQVENVLRNRSYSHPQL
jgi:hypothetical protein